MSCEGKESNGMKTIAFVGLRNSTEYFIIDNKESEDIPRIKSINELIEKYGDTFEYILVGYHIRLEQRRSLEEVYICGEGYNNYKELVESVKNGKLDSSELDKVNNSIMKLFEDYENS